jgi:hypothetical protein
VEQLKEFPVGEFEDGPDSLEMNVRLSMKLWNGEVEKPKRSR